MALRKISHVNEADHQLVTAAVAAAEHHTSGEIVTIVTGLSDDYGDIGLAWATMVAFLALSVVAFFPGFYLGLVDEWLGGWGHGSPMGEMHFAHLFTVVGKGAFHRPLICECGHGKLG